MKFEFIARTGLTRNHIMIHPVNLRIVNNE